MSETDNNNNKVKICLVIPSLQPGGMERVMAELLGQFAEMLYTELHLVLYGKSREIFYSIPEAVIVHRPEWEFDNGRRFLSTLRTIKWLRTTVKNINPDTILSFGEYWNSLALLALKWTPFPVYVSDRCKPDKNLGKLHERLRKWLYPGAAGVVAQTGRAREVYLQKGLNRNIRVIGNPIRDISWNESSGKKENIVLTVGRLIETKHHDRLIEVFNQVKREDWKLVIVGGNAIKQDGLSRLESKVKQKGLEGRVILTGTVKNVEEYYLKSKIFAFTSSSEGFPNVIGEAMSAGLPVVSYDCAAGPSDMIDDGKTGYLVDLFDDESFKDKLEKLMKNETLRKQMGEEASQKIKAYSVSDIGEQVYSFITEKQAAY